MDPCEDLKLELDIALEAKAERRKDAVIRFILGLIGFEWAYDLIKGKGIDWSVLIDLLILLDLAAAIAWLLQQLPKVGLTGLAGQIAKKLGPWAIAFLVIDLAIQIWVLIERLGKASDDFDRRVKEIYDKSDCPDKDKILKEKGIPVPG